MFSYFLTLWTFCNISYFIHVIESITKWDYFLIEAFTIFCLIFSFKTKSTIYNPLDCCLFNTPSNDRIVQRIESYGSTSSSQSNSYRDKNEGWFLYIIIWRSFAFILHFWMIEQYLKCRSYSDFHIYFLF